MRGDKGHKVYCSSWREVRDENVRERELVNVSLVQRHLVWAVSLPVGVSPVDWVGLARNRLNQKWGIWLREGSSLCNATAEAGMAQG